MGRDRDITAVKNFISLKKRQSLSSPESAKRIEEINNLKKEYITNVVNSNVEVEATLSDGFTLERKQALKDGLVEILLANPEVGEAERKTYPDKPESEKKDFTKKRIIGICGKPQAGKDVVADYFETNFKGVSRMAFSDQIIPEVNVLLEKVQDDLNSREDYPEIPDDFSFSQTAHEITINNKSIPMYRKLLQDWGIGKWEVEPNYWPNRTKEAVEQEFAKGSDLVIVTGIRLPEDITFVNDIGGEVWRVERPNNPYKAEHAVEDQISDIPVDRIILNDKEGDLSPYETNIETALAENLKTP